MVDCNVLQVRERYVILEVLNTPCTIYPPALESKVNCLWFPGGAGRCMVKNMGEISSRWLMAKFVIGLVMPLVVISEFATTTYFCVYFNPPPPSRGLLARLLVSKSASSFCHKSTYF